MVENLDKLDPKTNINLSTDLLGALRSLEYDATLRNAYMNRRDRYVYQDGLTSRLDIPDGADITTYNYLQRVVDIHTAQLMGRGFNVYSYYNKEDISIYENDPEQLQLAELRNKKRKLNADTRKRAIDGIVRDNGGMGIFKNGARVGSVYGETIFKSWFDKKAKKYNIICLESPQNYRAFWADDSFRERDADAFVYQISFDKAMRDWGSKLVDDQQFEISTSADLYASGTNNKTSDPLDQNSSSLPAQTDRPMVTFVDFTGYLKGWKADGKNIVPADSGEETRINVTMVGGVIVDTITDEWLMPRYWQIPNLIVPRRAWGESDLPDSALEINETIIQAMSDEITLGNKTLFPLVKAINFTSTDIPKKKQRRMQVVPMTDQQNLEVVNMFPSTLTEYHTIVDQLMDSFVRVTGVGRVLFDDPTINSGSNQALMTTLKGVIDRVEDKQSRWEPILVAMFTDALKVSAHFIKELKEAVTDATEEDWFLCTEWPSVLRREEAAYQQMYLNRFINNTISLETYLEKMGESDTSEEVDRLRDELKDPVTAAILGRQVGEMAHQTINKSLGIPPWGYVLPKVQLRGEMAPQEVGNIGHNFGWDQGPYGDHIGPTGMDGQIAADTFLNSGMTNGNVRDGGTGNYPSAPAPQSTPDQNQPGMASTPGSGRATPVSPGGAIAQDAQRRGA